MQMFKCLENPDRLIFPQFLLTI